MVNIFYFDLEKYDIMEARNMFQNIKELMPKDEIILALPTGTYFHENVDLSYLLFLRQQIDDMIEEYEKKGKQ